MTIQERIRPEFATELGEPDPTAPGSFASAFTATERAVINLANLDGVGSLRSSRGSVGWLRALLFPPARLSLANPKLEILRRASIAIKAGGRYSRGHEVEAALAVGYSHEQLSIVGESLRTGASTMLNRTATDRQRKARL